MVSTVITACYVCLSGSPALVSRLSRFDHGCLKRGRRDRREHSVNGVLLLHSKIQIVSSDHILFVYIYVSEAIQRPYGITAN